MNGSELNKVKKSIITICKNALGTNLRALVLGGSLDTQNYTHSWSDIDFLIVVDTLSLSVKRKVWRLKYDLERTYRCHFGINIITTQEFWKPQFPSISLDGKTLQMLLELTFSPGRMLYLKSGSGRRRFVPTSKDIKEYSLMNIFMFLLRNRRDMLTVSLKSTKELKEGVKREMRASFIISKLALQYFSNRTILDKEKLISWCEKKFQDFNFNTLRENILAVNMWNNINDRKRLEVLLEINDDFIERFSSYLLKKV